MPAIFQPGCTSIFDCPLFEAACNAVEPDAADQLVYAECGNDEQHQIWDRASGISPRKWSCMARISTIGDAARAFGCLPMLFDPETRDRVIGRDADPVQTAVGTGIRAARALRAFPSQPAIGNADAAGNAESHNDKYKPRPGRSPFGERSRHARTTTRTARHTAQAALSSATMIFNMLNYSEGRRHNIYYTL